MKIKIQDLKENPGILPFKLGTSKIKIASHTFLYYLDIPPIISQLNTLNTIYENIKNTIETSPLAYKSSLKNFYNHLDYEMNIVNQKIRLFELSKRNKRGLVNPLGSVIKFITGNLDHDDAVELYSNLEKLESSQNKIIKKTNMQLSITKNLMTHINKTMSLIVRNQETINQKVSELRKAINEVTFGFIHFLEIKDILNQLKVNLDSLLHFITEIENAITFAKLGVAHPSIITLDNLHKINLELKQMYNKDQLLFSKEENLQIYYNVIKTHAYFIADKIIITLNFPLVNSKLFNYYRLFSIPTKNKNTLLPPSSYLSISDTEYQYHINECVELDHSYLCEGQKLQQIQEADCITSLLSVQQEPKNCQYVPVQINKDIIEQINEGHYIGIFPNKEKLQTNCEQTNIVSLQGTYMFTVPPGCSLQTTHYNYTNQKGTLTGYPLVLEDIKLINVSIKKVAKLNIEKVSLNKLHELQLQSIQEEPLEEISTHQHISIFSSTISIVLIIIILALAFKKRRKHFQVWLRKRRQDCHPQELHPLDETQVVPP